jgi:hypothetical protein
MSAWKKPSSNTCVKNISTPDIKKYLNIEVDVYGNFSEKNIEI